MGIRDVNVFALYGQRKNTGDVSAPFYATNGIQFLTASIGYDGGATGASLSGYGIVPSSTTPTSNSTTPTALIAAGATSVTLTSATGYVAGGYIQVDVNNTTTPTTSEIRKISTLVGSVVTFDSPLNFAHASSAPLKYIAAAAATASITGSNAVTTSLITTASTTGVVNGMVVTGNGVPVNTTVVSFVANTSITVSNVITQANAGATFTLTGPAPQFVHTILQGNSLPSLTIEKNIGGVQSLTFAGSKIGKYNLKLAAGDTAAEFSASVISKSVAIKDVVTPISGIVNESPFVFAEASLTFMGNTVAQVMSVGLDIENGLKPTYTFNNSHDLQFLTPLTRKITGQMEVVFTSLDDSDWGYYLKMQSQAQASLSLTLTHPATATGGAESLTITLPQVNISKYADGLKLEDVVLSTLDFEASYALGAAVPQTISASVTNAVWLPY